MVDIMGSGSSAAIWQRQLTRNAARRRNACRRAKGASGGSPRACTTELLESRRFFSGSTTTLNAQASSDLAGSYALAAAAALSLNNQSATYASLTDTTVTMTGRSELFLTAAANPLVNSQIQLNSPDAWVFFRSIKPSVVNSTWLSQIRVNGATAIHKSNVRVVQHELGTVVIPHAPSYQPLTTFTGPNFTGVARSFGQYTYHNTTATLGEQGGTVSSFKLKRGYMATIAAEANGSGSSKVYVAQDNDLDVALLPSQLDNKARFIRVFPWRWVSKKGASDIGPETLNAAWHYNWNNSMTSPLDWEYVPIRQQRWWPGLPHDSADVTHLLGFNEPDNPVEDAYKTLDNGSVETALSVWPELMSTGLRLGSPAVTDGGKGWLYEFMDKAIARGLRVDFIAIHNYQANHTASSLYNWYKDIWDRYHLPIWVTEFNNGANWTGSTPTYDQNAAAIGSFIDMMDNTPWIERYSIYSRVEATREMTYSDGSLTPAGRVYHDNTSPVSYIQDGVGPTNSQGRGVAQYSFDGNTLDSSGYGNNAQTAGTPTYAVGQRGQAMQFDGTSTYARLTNSVGQGAAFSFAGWVKWDGGGNWQRLFDLGTGTNAYLFLTPSNGSKMRFAIKNGGAEQIVETNPLTVGQWTHVALTLGSGVARLYVNGSNVATNAAMTIKPSDFLPQYNYLGRSQYPDPLFKGQLDDVRITDTVLTQAQIAAMMAANQTPQAATPTVDLGPVRVGTPFSGTVAGQVTDLDPTDTITYAKASGPTWLNVAANGTLLGTPTDAASLLREIVVSATDSKGYMTFLVLVPRQYPGTALYTFDNNTTDTSGTGNHATPVGSPTYGTGKRGAAIQLNGTSSYVQLPSNIAQGTAFSFAGWINWSGGGNWQRVFDFGTNTSNYLFLTPSNGANMQFAIRSSGGDQLINTAIPAVGVWTHVAITLGAGVGRFYVNGTQVAAATGMTFTPADFRPTLNYLGKSQYAVDPLFSGSLDDVRIGDVVFTAAQIAQYARSVNAPTIATAAAASPNPVVNDDQATLSVLGADDGAEANLTYTWSTLSKPQGAADPTFSLNGTNAAKNTLATFTASGAYNFRVTITDMLGQSVTSDVAMQVTLASPLATVLGSAEAFGIGSHTLTFTFDQDVSVSNWSELVEITSADGMQVVTPTDLAYDAAAKTLTVYLPVGTALAKGNYVATLKAGTSFDQDETLPFYVLPGDAKPDRAVNFNDLLILAANFNGTGKTFLQGDFTGDGAVNFNDLLILASAFNSSLVAPTLFSSVAVSDGLFATSAEETPTRRTRSAAGELQL